MPGKRTMSSYKHRRKASPCRSLRSSICKKTKRCKMAKGKKRTFCRKRKSRHNKSSKRHSKKH